MKKPARRQRRAQNAKKKKLARLRLWPYQQQMFGKESAEAVLRYGRKAKAFFDVYFTCTNAAPIMLKLGNSFFKKVHAFEMELKKPVAGKGYAIRMANEWRFPDGYVSKGKILIMEYPPGNAIYSLELMGLRVHWVQGVKGQGQNMESARKSLGKHPAEMLLERLISAARPLHEIGLEMSLNRLEESKAMKMLIERYCRSSDRRGRLSIKRRRVRAALGLK